MFNAGMGSVSDVRLWYWLVGFGLGGVRVGGVRDGGFGLGELGLGFGSHSDVRCTEQGRQAVMSL